MKRKRRKGRKKRKERKEEERVGFKRKRKKGGIRESLGGDLFYDSFKLLYKNDHTLLIFSCSLIKVYHLVCSMEHLFKSSKMLD